MTQDEALQLLGLASASNPEEIKTAVTQKSFDLEEKLASAPTDSLKAKFQSMLDKVNEAEQALTASQTTKSRSPLSQTKMADLPGAAPIGSTTSSQSEHLQPGDTLSHGRYEIKEQIGEGGMGAVYHAFDTTRQEDMAIKVLLPSMISSARAKERFMNEAKISSKLSHPNIVNVLDVQEDGDLTFLVMELLEGQDLRTLMDNRKLVRQEFDEAEAKKLATALCDALDYAHKHTIHRDIKPENVWVTEDGEYKLMDFGIARVQSASQRTQTGAAMGTAYYMAPEQLKGTSNIDGRADQYALGILLYELLANEVPTGRFKPLREIRKDLSKSFSNAVEKSLEPYPEDRYADMASFSEALSLKGGNGVSIPKVSLSLNKSLGIAIGIVLLIGSVMGVNAYLDYQQAERIKTEKIAEAKRIKAERREAARIEVEEVAKLKAEEAKRLKAELAARKAQAKRDALARKNNYKSTKARYSKVQVVAPDIAANGGAVPVTLKNLNLQPGDKISLSIANGCRIFAAKNTGNKAIKTIAMNIKLARSGNIVLTANGHKITRKTVEVAIGGVTKNDKGLVGNIIASVIDFVIKPVNAASHRYGSDVCMSSLSNHGKSFKSIKFRSNSNISIKMKSRKKQSYLSTKILISHPMETGLRKNKSTNRKIPANYVRNVYYAINGGEILRMYIGAGLSKNPLIKINSVAGRSGDKVELSVADSNGQTSYRTIKVR